MMKRKAKELQQAKREGRKGGHGIGGGEYGGLWTIKPWTASLVWSLVNPLFLRHRINQGKRCVVHSSVCLKAFLCSLGFSICYAVSVIFFCKGKGVWHSIII